MLKRKIGGILVSTIVSSFIIGCGGGGGSSTAGTTNPTTTTGTFIDGKVSGVKYVNGITTGFTDANGQFNYTSGPISFYVGNIKLGEISSLTSDKSVFIQDLVGVERTNMTNPIVLNIGSILQSLDSDSTTDAIEIKESDFNKFNDVNTTIDANTNVTTILTSKIPTITVKTSQDVARHIENSLKEFASVKPNTNPLSITATSITNGAINVSKDASIVLTFNNDVKKSTINKDTIVLKDASSNVVDINITQEFNRVTIKPVTLSYSTTYTLTVKSTIEDYSSSHLGTANTILSFTTQSEHDTSSPVFTSSSTVSALENQTGAFTAVATDNRSTVTYTLTGTDSSAFNIDSSTGVVTFKVAPNYETKTSYVVTVVATDGANNSSSKDVTVNITNVNDTVVLNNITYEIITSPVTGKKWLDRNLGASQACTSLTDTLCYGDYYQWGRLADGHEKANSNTTSTLASDISNAGSSFIIPNSIPYDWTLSDSTTSARAAQWSKADGTGVCPIGFKVPTYDELQAETINSSIPYQSFLNFPLAGNRSSNGSILNSGTFGTIWSSSDFSSHSNGYDSSSDVVGALNVQHSVTYAVGSKTTGYSVRCIEGN